MKPNLNHGLSPKIGDFYPLCDSPELIFFVRMVLFFYLCSTFTKFFGEVLLLLKSNKWNGPLNYLRFLVHD